MISTQLLFTSLLSQQGNVLEENTNFVVVVVGLN